jgi:membrane dipeptidase
VGNDFPLLDRFARAGTNFVSLTIAGDDVGTGEAMHRLAWARAAIRGSDRLALVERADDIARAKQEGRLAVGLHLEGTRCLERDLDMVQLFYDLGIRHGILAFNMNNSAAGGCADLDDPGLSRYGRRLVAAMNRAGMIVDLSHTGDRSTLQVMEMTTAPVIISHSNARAVVTHYRNVSDEQIRACARTDGVVGISGSSAYLGVEPATAAAMFRHIDHIAQLVGPRHVGLGTDFVADTKALLGYINARPEEWPDNQGQGYRSIHYAPPETLPELTELMLAHGYDEASALGVLGENWLRVCRAAWK